jgi:hypothetical protein
LAAILSTWEKYFLAWIPMGKIENAIFFCFIHIGKIFSK